MFISHLALTVRDPAESTDFYLSVIGLEGVAYDRPWGKRLDLADGFMLALIEGNPLPAETRSAIHFGCALDGRDAVVRKREQLQARGVTEIEWEDAIGYTGVKVHDPDGYVVELSYDLT